MQAHLFAWSEKTKKLRHLCRYYQQVFLKKNKLRQKQQSLQHEGQDFRIMAAAILDLLGSFYVIFGTSSGHLILSRVMIGRDNHFNLI